MLAGAVTVLVVSCVCVKVVAAASWPESEVADEPELPSTATTEYEARLTTGRGACGCKGAQVESRGRVRASSIEASAERISGE